MNNNYKEVNMDDWNRKIHCQVFRNSLVPQYCVSFELDITNFKKVIDKNKYSFTYAFVFAVTKCANEIEEFRYRFLDDKVVLYNKIDTSFTYINKDTELFKVVAVPMQDTMQEYVELADKTQREQQDYFVTPPANNVYQFSSLPWVSYTHISHTESGKKDNAIPLFDWGKYFERDGKLLLPFSVQVHHSFVDGIHIGKLSKRLQTYLNELK